MSTPEQQILQAKDPAADEDDWEEFDLSNAKVTDPENGELVSLLEAGLYRPLTVTGKLAVQAHQTPLLIQDQGKHTAAIEVSQVTRFAYGQYGDGGVDLWAAGLAGWYKLRPSRHYRDIYNDMLEAVRLLYTLADLHNVAKSRKFKYPNVDQILNSISNDPQYSCDNLEDAEQVLYNHRRFIMASMLAKKEGINWETMDIFAYMRRQYAADFMAVQRIAEGKKPLKKRGRPSSRQGSDDGLLIESTGPVRLERRSSVTNEVALSKARELFETMEQARQNEDLRSSQLTIKGLSSIVADEYSLQSEMEAYNMIMALASDLIKLMQRTPGWPTFPIFRTLSSAKTKSPSPMTNYANLPSRPRTESLPTSDLNEAASDGASSDSVRPGIGGKGKSLLRPAGTQRPKRTRTSGKAISVIDAAFDDEMDIDSESFVVATTRNAAASNPRKRKSRRDTTAVDAETPISPVENGTKDDATALPLRLKPSSTRKSTLFTVIEEALPTYSPQGPGGTWTCPYDGCMHKIYGESEMSKALIKEHYHEHAVKGQNLLDLIKSEERPYAPVGNLINHIRALAEKGITLPEGASALSKAFPEPIQRKYQER